ncbi:LiaF transmembrane domain-containing protein [Janthinobacterium fluminis]|uniref:DUF5668 domain-containing protein n=1 Tax=Janthinobacterium fluminis TaxID=2987524 RepID=A0ABT5K0B0_9BURK|nr:DUF5668 domain-containing protein [Janthinobacterium fluminis]MDC8758344.1 DUF5668 domain-containing protein [Janthinobacterium fluminis]
MGTDHRYSWRKQLLWGLLLIGLGTLLLLERLHLIAFDPALLWQYWPALLVVFGINKLLPPASPRQIVGGLGLIAFAVWYYLSFEQLLGLNFRNSWPFLLIGWGVGLVLEPLLNNYVATKERKNEE